MSHDEVLQVVPGPQRQAEMIMDRWTQFRDAIGRLSIRHKPKLEQWQRLLGPVFVSSGSGEVIDRSIQQMFATADTWCAGGRVDEKRAAEEFDRAIATIKFWQGKGDVAMSREPTETEQQRIERATALISNPESPAFKTHVVRSVEQQNGERR
jgi:hypothetical protein